MPLCWNSTLRKSSFSVELEFIELEFHENFQVELEFHNIYIYIYMFFLELEFHLKIFKELEFHKLEFYTKTWFS